MSFTLITCPWGMIPSRDSPLTTLLTSYCVYVGLHGRSAALTALVQSYRPNTSIDRCPNHFNLRSYSRTSPSRVPRSWSDRCISWPTICATTSTLSGSPRPRPRIALRLVSFRARHPVSTVPLGLAVVFVRKYIDFQDKLLAISAV